MRSGRGRSAPAGDGITAEPSGKLARKAEAEDEGGSGGVDLLPAEEYLTISEAARYLSISEPVLRMTVRCGKIPSRRRRRGLPLIKKKHLLPFLYPLLEGRLD